MRIIRDWKCPLCGYIALNVPDDQEAGPCPNDGTKLEKMWSAPTQIFKGDGWTPIFHH